MSYTVKIDGDVSVKEKPEKNKYKNDPDNGQVNITFKTSYEAAKANSEGNLVCSYDTDSLPAGNYTITIGDTSEEFTLNPAKEKHRK